MGSADIEGRLLRWRRPRISERRCLLAPHDAAIVALAPRSAAGSVATGESATGSWTFKRVGPASTRIAVGAAASGTDLAVYTPNTWSGGGTLAFPDGHSIRITTNSRQAPRDRAAG